MRPFLIALTTAFVWGCASHTSSKTASEAVRFSAVVSRIEPLEHATRDMIRVHSYPHYALSLHVVSASPPSAEFQPERDVVFAIHSWSRMFEEDWDRDVIGRQFEFTFSRAEGHAHLEVLRRIE